MVDSEKLANYEIANQLSSIGAGYAIIGHIYEPGARYFIFTFTIRAQRHTIIIILQCSRNPRVLCDKIARETGSLTYLVDARIRQVNVGNSVRAIVREQTEMRDNLSDFLRGAITRYNGPTVYDPRRRRVVCIDADVSTENMIFNFISVWREHDCAWIGFPDPTTVIGETLTSYDDGLIKLNASQLSLMCRAHRIERQAKIRELIGAGKIVFISEYFMRDFGDIDALGDGVLQPDLILTVYPSFPAHLFAKSEVIILEVQPHLIREQIKKALAR